eukprot:162397_1
MSSDVSPEKILVRFANSNDLESVLKLMKICFGEASDDLTTSIKIIDDMTAIVAESMKTKEIISSISITDKGDDFPTKKYWCEAKYNLCFDNENLKKKYNILRKEICEMDDFAVLPKYRSHKFGLVLGFILMFIALDIPHKRYLIGVSTDDSNRFIGSATKTYSSNQALYDKTSKISITDIQKACNKLRTPLGLLLKSKKHQLLLSANIVEILKKHNVKIPQELILNKA